MKVLRMAIKSVRCFLALVTFSRIAAIRSSALMTNALTLLRIPAQFQVHGLIESLRTDYDKAPYTEPRLPAR